MHNYYREQRGIMSLYILYDSKKLISAYGSGFIVRMQDNLAVSNDNCLFIDIVERARVRKFVHDEACSTDSIILIGNDRTCAFEKVQTPVSDGDGKIDTDNFWSSSMNDMVIPEFAVSRIPDAVDDTADTFLKRIERTMKKRTVHLHEKTGITAAIWEKAAQSVFDSIKGMGDMKKSPPLNIKKMQGMAYDGMKGAMYYNLHGSKNLPGWYGQRARNDNSGEEFPLAIMPESFKNGCQGGFIFSEACFGGYVCRKKRKKSIIIHAIDNGMPFAIGSTATAYGTFRPPLGEADLLAQMFHRMILKHHQAGIAFMKAKRAFANEMIKRYGFLDDDDRKTLLTFTMYGNPLTEVKYE